MSVNQTSPVDIVNQALAQIGSQSQVTSINPSDGSQEGDIASLFYNDVVNDISRAAHWNCLRFQAQLTELTAASTNGVINTTNPPPVPWQYEYAYPPDCLQCRYIMPYCIPNNISPPLTTAENLAIPWAWNGPPPPYLVVSANDPSQLQNSVPIRAILTNATPAILVYTRQVTNPELWDPHFKRAVVNALAAYLVNGLARNRSLAADLMKVAGDTVAMARISDGNEQVMSQDNLPDWIRTRGTLGYWYGNCYGPWQSLSFNFPGGSTF